MNENLLLMLFFTALLAPLAISVGWLLIKFSNPMFSSEKKK